MGSKGTLIPVTLNHVISISCPKPTILTRLAIQELINSPQLPLAVDQLKGINCPVLVVIGENDFAAPATKLLDSLPNATYLELKGVDHFATPKNFTFMETALKFIDAEPQW